MKIARLKADYEKVIIYAVKFTVEFESGVMVDVNELVERFVRGDKSRNTEGSGLGLAIAKSFIELQGGAFDVSIDGDLFKAEIRLLKFE